MKEPHDEGVANHVDPESCVDGREAGGEASTGARASQVSSRENTNSGMPTPSPQAEGNTRPTANRKVGRDSSRSETLRAHGSSESGSREIPSTTTADGPRSAEAKPRGEPKTNVVGKSDGPVVPVKLANKGGAQAPPAERVEGRGPAKENPGSESPSRTQSRIRLAEALARVREVATTRQDEKFTAIWHHVYDVERLREAYFGLGREAAPGVDRVTWQQYQEALGDNLADLGARLARGAYRPAPVRRVYIPKADGRQRPIGVPTLEDKIVQRAVVEVLQAVYEPAFHDASYGFRPGRSQHDALDALGVGVYRQRVNYVLDADIRGFFDTIDHGWMLKFIEHRIGDQRVLRAIEKWLTAGVLEDGELRDVARGTPQGGSVSPFLANVYLHYVLDLWLDQWRRRHAGGDMLYVRYADDFLVGFEYEADAHRFLADLRERLQKFALELHPDKTRLVEFGRYAIERRERRGEGKPETFDFLGFTHVCTRTSKGKFRLVRLTSRKKLSAKLADLKIQIQRRARVDVRALGPWLKRVVLGHDGYYGVIWNHEALRRFRDAIARLWFGTLQRLSQRSRTNWARMSRLVRAWIPKPGRLRIPSWDPIAVRIQGRSPVR